MVSQAYLSDVRLLASAASASPIEEQIGQLSDFSTEELYLSAFVESSNLDSGLAVLQALRLSFDAAAIAVEFSIGAVDIDLGSIPDARLQELLASTAVAFTVVDLANGSWRISLKIDPRTPEGLGKILAVVGLGVAIFGLLVPPAAVVMTGVGWVFQIAGTALAFMESRVTTDNVQTVDADALRQPGAVEVEVVQRRPSAARSPRRVRPRVKVFISPPDGATRFANAVLAKVLGSMADIRLDRGYPDLVRVTFVSDEPIDENILYEIADDVDVAIKDIV